MNIGERLILLRKTLGINQSDLALVLGCTQANISQYEKNGAIMSAKYLIPLRNAYNVNLEWLLLGVGGMFLPDTFVHPSDESQTSTISVNPERKDKLLKDIDDLSVIFQRILLEMKDMLGEK